MFRPRVLIVKDPSSVAVAGADVVEELITERPDAVLALPTGRTPIDLYRELVRRTRLGRIDWSRVRAFNLDEWVGVPADSEASYASFMNEHLYAHVNMPATHRFIPNGLAPDLDGECRQYEDAIESVGGIELAILGIGRNGHIGFNEPGTPFEVRTHVATVSADTRAANAYSFPGGDPPSSAITVGIATIMLARRIVLLATGDEKALILRRALEGAVDVSVPASVLQRHSNVTIIADERAGSLLPRPVSER